MLKFKSGPLVVALMSLVALSPARAEDEASIKGLRDALVALSPDVDPGEAQLMSATVHNLSRSLAREYGVNGDPAVHNFLINIGKKRRGYCAHYVRDMGPRLRQLNFKTLVMHWGAAYARTSDESNCIVVTARNQRFEDGILLDAWRHGGKLFWSSIRNDREYDLGHHPTLNRSGGHNQSGVSAWKEDLEESAWLQGKAYVKTQTRRKS
jgi:hypothetical protein